MVVKISDRLKAGEDTFKTTDRRGWLEHQIQGLVNQAAFGFNSRASRVKLTQYQNELEALKN